MGDNRSPAAPGSPLLPAQIVVIAREVVREVEPEELVVFDAVAESWRAGDLPSHRRRRGTGAAVGFGVQVDLVSQLVFPIITGALGQVLGTPLTERIHLGRRPRHRQAADDGEATNRKIALSVEQLRTIHEVCQGDATTLGMSKDKAQLLADAVVGALSGAAGRIVQ